MQGIGGRWERLGRILRPDPTIDWLSTSTGPAFALQSEESSIFDIYVAGRDSTNRSLIGRIRIDLEKPTRLLEISDCPVLECGNLGAFDENGVSYPCLVRYGGDLLLYYTGWMPTVLTPFQNHLGLAVGQSDGSFRRLSRAPILERTNEDYLSMGSACVQIHGGIWSMWYTSFLGWGRSPEEPKHRYVIKYASSADGVDWKRENRICIGLKGEGEHSISRPSVLHHGGRYHMWYCYRGGHYRIGYSSSNDGIVWQRDDEYVDLEPEGDDWESEALCYPNVFRYGDHLYMLYCGNEYGKSGLGLARLRLET